MVYEAGHHDHSPFQNVIAGSKEGIWLGVMNFGEATKTRLAKVPHALDPIMQVQLTSSIWRLYP